MKCPLCKQIQPTTDFLLSTCTCLAERHYRVLQYMLIIYVSSCKKVKPNQFCFLIGGVFISFLYLIVLPKCFPSLQLWTWPLVRFVDANVDGGVNLRFSFSLICWRRKGFPFIWFIFFLNKYKIASEYDQSPIVYFVCFFYFILLSFLQLLLGVLILETFLGTHSGSWDPGLTNSMFSFT